ncbi:Hint domain-containing protein [Shimia abyssi]|uniref:Hint domain-containing protein n=1 Tax=Shimia abyssi TaxID=1662395 RepID=A0A2P8FJ37_9RHOB|nr:Hint domain-containing protein [Shimia abyssi]PSL21713.1 Hint domain-containing protein [Shimia abyssi]
MAIETLTIPLGADEDEYEGPEISGKDILEEFDDDGDWDLDDRHIVEVTDGGDISGTIVFAFWGKDRSTEAGDGDGGNDRFTFDLSGFDDDFHIEIKSFDALDKFIFTGFDSVQEVGDVYRFSYTGTDGQPHTVTIDPVSKNGTGTVSVLCFTDGTLIRTPMGDVPIEDLSVGDMVMCGDGEARAIKWIGERKLSHADLIAHPNLKPVFLEANAMAPDQPATPLRLSPQHRVMLRDWRAELLMGEEEVLVPAKSLINDQSIRTCVPKQGVTYFHILLRGHHTLFANNLECETLLPADMAKTALSGEARQEILTVFPELVTDFGAFGPACGQILKSYEARAVKELCCAYDA